MLDGKLLPWHTNGILDRSFYEFKSDFLGFSVGDHVLEFQGTPPNAHDPIRQLCSVTLHEYMDDSSFNMVRLRLISVSGSHEILDLSPSAIFFPPFLDRTEYWSISNLVTWKPTLVPSFQFKMPYEKYDFPSFLFSLSRGTLASIFETNQFN